MLLPQLAKDIRKILSVKPAINMKQFLYKTYSKTVSESYHTKLVEIFIKSKFFTNFVGVDHSEARW